MANRRTIGRGEIWLIRFDPAVGAEIRKLRPAVVVSDDSVGRLPLRIVVPVTDWNPRYAALSWIVHLPVSRESGLVKDSAADSFQIKSLSEQRFVRRLGVVTNDQLDEITDAIALCVGVE